MADANLLQVEELCVRLASGAPGDGRALVDGVSFRLGAERVALVGESGSGKTLTARALLGLLRAPLSVHAACLQLAGAELRQANERDWVALRGRVVSLVLQDPRFCLNPVLTAGAQLEQARRVHAPPHESARARRARILERLRSVGVAEPHRVLRAYPHELSGGMGQRVMLAIALLNEPQVLIADEPTSSLDADLRDQVLELMGALVQRHGMGLLLISHDLQQVARHCDRVLVMYQGRIVDRCAAAQLSSATHPYTRMLWAARPSARTHGHVLPVLSHALQAIGERP